MKRRSKLSRTKRDGLVGWIFCLPLVIGTLLVLIPVVWDSIRFSFNELTMQEVGYTLDPVGWENYRQALFVDPTFVRSILTSLGGLLMQVPAIVIFSLFIAVLLNHEMPGRAFFRMVLFIPVILSVGYFETAMSGDIMSAALSDMSSFDTGVEETVGFFTTERISEYLIRLNISTSFANTLVSLLGSIATIINQSGVQILIFLAGLQSISPSIYESAQIEGATGWESFWKITVPVISPMILVNLIYSFINAFTSSSNGIMKNIQSVTFHSFQFGKGAAMSWIYFAFIIVLIAVVYAVVQKMVFYEEKG